MTSPFDAAVRDERALTSALETADFAPALMTLVYLTGDFTLLDEVSPHIKGAWSFLESVPEPLKKKVRTRLVTALKEFAAEGAQLPPLPDPKSLRRMMSASVGAEVPEEYVPLFVEELRLGNVDTRALQWRSDPGSFRRDAFKVVIVGAGLSGVCAGIRLKEAGIPFVILERNTGVGGTWFENHYPGAGVDTPNQFYSYSFNPNPDWSRHFSLQNEIWKYIDDTVDKFDLRQHIRFGVEVTGANFDEAGARWHVSCRASDGEAEVLQCNVLITAAGHNVAATPSFQGLETFAGEKVHTAHWDHRVDLSGKRVAMIGTGASGMQVGPAVAGAVDNLTIFQRTPHWAMGNANYHRPTSDGQRWALKNIPLFNEWARFLVFWAASDGFHKTLHIDPNWHLPAQSLNSENHAMRENIIAYMRNELDGDEELLRKCTPDYPPYGKRLLRDNNWFKMLKRPNVDLVTDPISHITESGVVTKDGSEYKADVLVLATGFHASKLLWPMEIRGLGGTSIRDVWGDDDPRAYKGMTVPGFPNLFIVAGPNTILSHGGSAIFHTECQVTYILQAVREMVEKDVATIEVRENVYRDYNDIVDNKLQNMVWSHRGVTSWYKNKRNRVTMTSPWRLVDFWQITHAFDPNDFMLVTNADHDVSEQQPV
ncbi:MULTISPECIES: flavin-containing monooxygenase [Paraburkholderia]|uniref:flavin-containing monooxygenase n=1 Tax=Paraburkholderia TaxID=1822464 RepID=UPI00224DD58E|nr:MULTISPECIES: NAD(P)/FAD-dependent oxidoreductase [Paraburkholderia]MCX4174538.1 NAD(P)/FAD-dependent oxidoreductase [Paraburkholderia madseniana]MDQ6462539.1 NAD(P)/FAD-dependent oxidoreductase [Paraburkholderia madseniana]